MFLRALNSAEFLIDSFLESEIVFVEELMVVWW